MYAVCDARYVEGVEEVPDGAFGLTDSMSGNSSRIISLSPYLGTWGFREFHLVTGASKYTFSVPADTQESK